MRNRLPTWSIGPLLIWAVVILLLVLVATVARSAESAEPPSLKFDSPATVSVVGPWGRPYCVSVPVHWTIDERGIHAQMVVPGPVAGRPWTCQSSRTWESMAEEFDRRREEFLTLARKLGMGWLAKLIEQARDRP